MSANLRRYVRSLYGLDAVVRRVPADAWGNQSPCDEWTNREVLGHVLWGIGSVTSTINGGGPMPERAEAEVAGPHPDQTWDAALGAILDALDQQGVLQRQIETPFGTQSVDEVAGFFFGDVVMHTWDIATGAGIAHAIPDALADAVVAQLRPLGDALRRPGALGPEQTAPDGASPADKMAAYGGRTVPS